MRFNRSAIDMLTTLQLLQQLFLAALKQSQPQYAWSVEDVEIKPSTQPQFGHYQLNSAMRWGKQLKQAPRDIATQLMLALQQIGDTDSTLAIADYEIAGPGFINITLRLDYMNNVLQKMLTDERLSVPKLGQRQRIIVDFSSPNIAKEMHVGHLRSTIIGDSLARVFEYLDYDVLRLNHVGDWGTAFGMLIAYLKKMYPAVIDGKQETDLSELMQWYRAAKTLFDEDQHFKQQAQQEVVLLQRHEAVSLKIWQMICDISRRGYQAIYDLLDIKITERGESFYNEFLSDVVADLYQKHLISISDDAKCVFLDGFTNRDGSPLPLIIQKSDGGYNYATTDLAALKHRISVDHAQQIFYIVDAGQAVHFQMIFKTAEMAGYLDLKKVRVLHVPFGLVLGPDGKKFRTRAGSTERLIDLLQTAIDKAKQILLERKVDLAETEVQHTATQLGLNAIKYADLSCHRMSDYTFSYERMLKFEGNTAAFLMYAYVRIASIKRKTKANVEQLLTTTRITLVEPTELALGTHLMLFGEVLIHLSEDLLPNRLTEYLFGLAEKFNAFFRDCRVEGAPQQNTRLLLCEVVGRVLRQGMKLLGLTVVEKM